MNRQRKTYFVEREGVRSGSSGVACTGILQYLSFGMVLTNLLAKELREFLAGRSTIIRNLKYRRMRE